VFRRNREDDEVEETQESEAPATENEVPAEPVIVERGPTTGPWDLNDVPKEDATARVDLGSLAIPIPEGVELRVEVADDTVVAAALVDGASQLVVNAFAAPKSAGIWEEVRQEIGDSLKSGGGSAEPVDGAFGPELQARIPAETGGHQPARFVGVDGPRWFLRGLLTGPAATDPAQASRLDEVFRGIVVARGGEAMAPRDALPLHLPREVLEQAAGTEAGDDDPEERRLELQERGPDISELR
jgi:hypothetical protein